MKEKEERFRESAGRVSTGLGRLFFSPQALIFWLLVGIIAAVILKSCR
jgi:hypothetical protein